MDGNLKSRRQSVLVCGALFAIALYMLAWLDVPLFYDEASFRRLYGRAFIDGFLLYSFFPVCAEPKAVPFVFVPSHIVFSWIDGWPNWVGVRLLPLGSIAGLAVATTMLVRQQQSTSMNWGWSLAILCGGFIGLSGAGLVLSRWEYLVTLQITMCLVTWMVASQEPVPLWGTVSVLAVHLFAILLSLFVHPQGLLVMPLSFLTCVYLLRSHRWLAVGVGGLLVLLSVQSLVHNQFRCPEDPELEAVIAKTHGVVLTNQLAGYSLIERMVHRAVHFERQFFFQYVEAMSIPVPQLPEAVALIVNPPIAVVVSFNLLGLVLGFAYALRLLWRAHYVTLRRRQWWLFVKNVAVDARALWALSAFLVLFYSLFDFGGVFYRAHFRNLLSALLLAIAGVHIAEAVGLKWLKRWSILSSATCIVSALVAWFFLTPQLAQGYESYYVSLQRDWPTFNNRVRALANRCGITKDDEHVVVDVATYNAMREHPRTLDFLYVWYDEYLKGTLDPDRTPQEWLNLYKRFSTSGYVVRCQTLQFAKLPIQYRDADICCLGF